MTLTSKARRMLAVLESERAVWRQTLTIASFTFLYVPNSSSARHTMATLSDIRLAHVTMLSVHMVPNSKQRSLRRHATANLADSSITQKWLMHGARILFGSCT